MQRNGLAFLQQSGSPLALPAGMQRRSGFTLIELLIVMVIIGILASIAIQSYQGVKRRSYRAQMQSDLRHLMIAQEQYMGDNGTYAPNVTLLQPAFVATGGNTLTVTQASGMGWAATATSANSQETCAIFVGTAPVAPATVEGVAGCQ